MQKIACCSTMKKKLEHQGFIPTEDHSPVFKEWGRPIYVYMKWTQKQIVSEKGSHRIMCTKWTYRYSHWYSYGYIWYSYRLEGYTVTSLGSKLQEARDLFILCTAISPTGFPDGSVVKNSPAMQETQETQLQSPGWEYPLGEEMATYSSILAWEIPWTEEPGGLQSRGSQKSWTWLSNWAGTHITDTQNWMCSTSVQFSSVARSCPTLCNPINRSTPGFPVHHQLPEFTQTYVHQVGDAIQPSHPLSSPSPPAPNPSQHQDLFQWVNSMHEVAKVLKFQPQHQSFQWTPRTDLL